MNNKSLFISITLALALMVGFVFYNQQIAQLEQKIGAITDEYNAEIEAIQFNVKVNDSSDSSNDNVSTLDDLNNQLVAARTALKIVQQKSSLATNQSSVLKDAHGEVKLLKNSLKKSEQKLKVSGQKLKISGEKLDYLQRVFESQNKDTVDNNIARITELQGSAASIGIAGLIVPVVGIAMLTSYAITEVNNYCANIKNIINLEEQVFKKVVSLDAQMKQDYHNKCN